MADSSLDTDLICRAWGLADDCSFTPVESFNGGVSRVEARDGRVYYLKRRPDEDHVARESALLSWLCERTITVAPPLITYAGQPSLRTGDEVFALYPALSGEITPDHFDHGAEERAKSYGTGIAHLHEQLAQYPHLSDFRIFDPHDEIAVWTEHSAHEHLSRLEADHVPEAARAVCEFLEAHQPGLRAHLIHRDLHPANMLLVDGQISAYLDFDLACVGIRLFDPCYCLTSMLVGGFRDEANRHRWLSLLTSLLSGYGSILPLEEGERHAVFPVLIAIQLLFLAFSCRTDRFGAAQYNADVITWLLENHHLVEMASGPVFPTG